MPAPPLKLGLLNHIALPSANPEEHARFYEQILGFEITTRPAFSFRGSWLFLRASSLMIHLIHDASLQFDTTTEIDTRNSHHAFQTADYDQAIRQLQSHEVPYVERVLPDHGYRQVFFRDLDGHVFELGEWPTPDQMLESRAPSSVPS